MESVFTILHSPFDSCTETIVRQAKGIGRLVDEFSAFARRPQPQFKLIDLVAICSQIVSFEETRFPQIEYILDIPDQNVEVYGDRQQISQVLSNILKNAAESIVTRFSNNDEKENGLISMDMEEWEESVRSPEPRWEAPSRFLY